MLHRDSTLSSNVFNANGSASVPTTPGGGGGTYLGSHDDPASTTALMEYHAGAGDRSAQRSVSDRRPRPPPPVDASSDLIEMESFRYYE